MSKRAEKHTGIIVALAWPKTYCRQAGAWYDPLMNLLGFSHNHFYKVGHAALLLVNPDTNQCHYFDFGRYHSPFGTGRVRSEVTDPELTVRTKAIIEKDRIVNLDIILKEMQSKEVYHGDETLFASTTTINFKSAYNKAIELQKKSPMVYGPYVRQGTNCSRFVNTVILAGKPKLNQVFKLIFGQPTTPTPRGNVNALNDKHRREKPLVLRPFNPYDVTAEVLKSTAPAPVKIESVPKGVRWLSGEGYGSWYDIQPNGSTISVSRYSPKGLLEFKAEYVPEFDVKILNKDYELSYLSHFKEINIVQNGKKYTLRNVNL